MKRAIMAAMRNWPIEDRKAFYEHYAHPKAWKCFAKAKYTDPIGKRIKII